MEPATIRSRRHAACRPVTQRRHETVDAVEDPRIVSVADDEVPRLVHRGSAFLATITVGSEQDHLTPALDASGKPIAPAEHKGIRRTAPYFHCIVKVGIRQVATGEFHR
jgi:hypothetical protein